MSVINIKQLNALTPFKVNWLDGETEQTAIFYLDYLQGVLLDHTGNIVDENLSSAIFAQVKGEVHDAEVPSDINDDIEAAQAAIIDEEANKNVDNTPEPEETDAGHEIES